MKTKMKAKLIFLILMAMNSTYAQTAFKAERVQKTASFVANTTIEKAFPLFGPIRESEWTLGWEPKIIYSTHPEVEEHMVFKVEVKRPGENEYLWAITQYRPKEYFVEYTVSTALRIWFIS